MSDEKKRRVIEGYDYLAHSASSNDCTGLIPSGLNSRAEREAYKDLYPYEPPKLHSKHAKDKTTPSK